MTDTYVNTLYTGVVWKPAPLPPRRSYDLNDSFEHEGTTWYQLHIYDGKIGGWIEKHDEDLWWENTPEWKNTRSLLLYTVHEKLYTCICLKWGQ